MPCKPAKARHLLKAGKAKVAMRTPFTIKLNWQCEGNVQPVKIGLDKGAKYTGFSVIGNGKILIDGVINHRNNVSKQMENRKTTRKDRRSRLWYRAIRYLNRYSLNRAGRIPPSIKANVEEVYRVVKKLPLPISEIWIEDVQIDISKLNNPDLQGKDYQKSSRLHENLRLACLMRDEFKCRICKKDKIKLEAHHIQFRSNGGKDTINNLATLCDKCHDLLHAGKVSLDMKGENGFKDRMAQRTMQGKTHLYQLLGTVAPVNKVYGYETAEYRKSLGLKKEHYVDAMCIASLRNKEVIWYSKDNFYNINFRASQNRKHYYMLPRKGKGRVKYQVNKDLHGFRKGDLVLVKSYEKIVQSIYSTGLLFLGRIKNEPTVSTPKKCKLLTKAHTINFVCSEQNI